MKSKLGIGMAIASFLLISTGLWSTTPGTSQNVQLVGQNTLLNRGMNAALAIFDHYLYVGSRTDGSSRCGIGDPRRTTTGLNSCPHPNPGVLVLDINNPAAPTLVNEFGDEFTTGTFAGQTSRELRVWPEQKLLMIMYFRCSSIIHACTRPATDDWRIRFFDLSDPVHPALVSTYVPPSKPHEMFLWVDPNKANRALLFLSTPNIFADANPNLIVTDISNARKGIFTQIAQGNWNNRFAGTDQANYPFDATSRDGCGPYDCNLFVHSMGVKADGTLTFLALEAGHFLVLDTSQVAAGRRNPQLVLLTDPDDRPVWLQNPPQPDAVPNVSPNDCARVVSTSAGPLEKDCPNSHSAVKVPGRKLALTADEVYGTFTFAAYGCRWGWARLIDISDPSQPFITGEYMIDENSLSFCGTPADDAVTESTRSYSSHNPTLTQNLAIIDWHSGGLQIIDTSDPTHPVQAGFFVPGILATPTLVANEDPALSQGTDSRNNKAVFWSYPIINNGLIYAVDVRNGLYVFQYTGPHAAEVSGITFLEGNSNLGDAVALDKN